MRKQQNLPAENSMDKFDKQLLTILSADLKFIRYLRTKNIDQLLLSNSSTTERTA